jgi:hypothetical protein
MWRGWQTSYPAWARRPGDDELEVGALVGLVDLVEVVEQHFSPWFQGRFGYVLERPRPLRRAIPCSGRLGFWRVSPTLLEAIPVL